MKYIEYKRSLLSTISLFLIPFWGFSQQTVNGTVRDTDGESLIGVNIIVKDFANQGTISDYDGAFELEVPSEATTLAFSYTGYVRQEIAIAGRVEWNIIMENDIQTLDEIVVVGYGVQRKSDLTGAIASITSKELQRIPTSSFAQALQGKIAGVQVTPSSGEPGKGAEIRIRGVGTLNDASPLYVVDGMLLDDISFINLQDVESVEVLKDASATAIYGSRGANGVIIVTTKKGEISDRSTISLSTYTGWQQLANKIVLTNANQYATLANELAVNEKRPLIFQDPNSFGEGVDWQDEIYRTAPIQNHSLAVRGGNESILYQISADYFNQDGIQSGSNYQRFTLRLNNEYTVSKHVKVGHNLAIVRIWETISPDQSGTAYRADPTITPQAENGTFNDLSTNASTGNPIASIFYANSKNKRYRMVGNAYLDVKPWKNIVFRSSVGLDIDQTRGKFFTPVFYVSATQRNDESVLTATSNQIQSWLWENTMTYFKEWTNHRLTLLGGMTSQVYNSENLSGTGRALIGDTDEFLYLAAATSDQPTNSNSAFEWAMLSYLFRVNYTFKNKYLFTGSFRVDGSSRFGAENRYGYFPSLALGWNLINEPFMNNQLIFSRLKLRTSWGVIGNDKIGAYPGRPLVNSPYYYAFGANEKLNVGATIEGLPNATIQWEETSQFNFGFEFGFLNNRLLGEIDYYERTTDKILIDLALPGHFGIRDNFPFVNAAKVKNNGIDLKIDWKDKINQLNYTVGVVLSTVKNEVLELGENKSELIGGSLSGGKFGTRTIPGLPIGAFYGYQTEGIFQNAEEIAGLPRIGGEAPGDLRYRDVNRDGIITTADRTYLGSAIPELIWGASLGLEYAGIDFNIDFNGQQGNLIYNSKKQARFGTYNFDISYLDRWTGEGSSNREPRVTNGGHNYEVSDRFLEDGSYWRIRNISLGYSLPVQVLSKYNIKQLRIYVSGTNILTTTEYTGYAPEFSSGDVLSVGIDRGIYPIAKTYNFGLNLSF
ncbi:MAG: TonB-dependent receptor [Saprospiraceae bacterium]|nr:TonB-dependent receptor [Saprospiraceae bacterium]